MSQLLSVFSTHEQLLTRKQYILCDEKPGGTQVAWDTLAASERRSPTQTVWVV